MTLKENCLKGAVVGVFYSQKHMQKNRGSSKNLVLKVQDSNCEN